MLHGHRFKNVVTRTGNIQFRLTAELDTDAGQRPGNILLARRSKIECQAGYAVDIPRKRIASGLGNGDVIDVTGGTVLNVCRLQHTITGSRILKAIVKGLEENGHVLDIIGVSVAQTGAGNILQKQKIALDNICTENADNHIPDRESDDITCTIGK